MSASVATSEIQTLLFSYALGVDRRDQAALAECFVADSRIIGPGYELTGPIAAIIVSELQRRFVWTQHNVFNPLYETDGDTAIGVVNCVASHVERQPDGGYLKHDWHIRYHDRLIRQGGRWRFLERRMDVPFIATGPVTALAFSGVAGGQAAERGREP
jgi:hypothetical protein